jgi:hypothetical protein
MFYFQEEITEILITPPDPAMAPVSVDERAHLLGRSGRLKLN